MDRIVSRTTLSLLAVVLVLAAIAVAGCSGEDGEEGSSSPAASDTEQVSSTSSEAGQDDAVEEDSASAEDAAAEEPAQEAAAPPAVSSSSIAYAESLGGTSHEGDALHLIIGASVESEAQAQAMLDKAVPLFGDMQSYFIVQRSDNFDGLEPGWWIVIEAYYDTPSQENLDFAGRGFPDAYVKQATVRTSDPIPVYEDMVGD